jgi:hypothetical protein
VLSEVKAPNTPKTAIMKLTSGTGFILGTQKSATVTLSK